MKSVMNLRAFCLVVWALHTTVAALSHDGAASQLALAKEDPKEKKNKPVVVKIEEHITKSSKKHKNRVMGAINQYRAEICANMKNEYGIEFDTFDACKKFMTKACKPGKDKEMDGDRKERPTGVGHCHEYFPEAEEKAEKEVAKIEEEEAEVAPSPAPAHAPSAGPAPAPASAAKAEAPAPAPKADKKEAPAPAPAAGGSAPSPGPAGSPAGPAPAPFIPGVTGGKPYGKIADDESYYFKKGGKDVSRLHMDGNMKLPAQGYWGKLIEHDDMKTMTSDWGSEFGPKAGHGNIETICKENPESTWCQRRGYGKHLRSSGHAAFAQILPLAIAFLGFLCF